MTTLKCWCVQLIVINNMRNHSALRTWLPSLSVTQHTESRNVKTDYYSYKRNELGAQYSQYISSILFVTCTCFGPLHVHHQEEQLYLYDTWYFVILYS
jgi:hypothetical protein